jgi:serine protease Do
MAYCGDCGAQLGPQDRFCTGCGRPMDGAAVDRPVIGSPSPRRAGRLAGPMALLVLALAVLVLAGGGVGAYTLLAGQRTHQPSARAATAPSPRRSVAPGPVGTASSAASSPAPASFAQLYAQDSSGVVRIDVTNCTGGAVGSGFLISPTLVATAAHVVAGAATIGLTAGGHTTVGTVVGVSDSTDVALVESSAALAGHVFTLGTTQPAVGVSLAAIGFPEGGPLTFTSGTVSGLDRTISIDGTPRTGLLETDAAINPGNSGGPLLLTDGTVVGLADAALQGASGIAYGVPVQLAGPLLDSWQASPSPQPPASCPDPTGPQGDPVHVTAGSGDAAAVGAVLATYFEAIDGGDYQTAYEQLAPSQQALMSEAAFASSESSSYDFDVVVSAVSQVAAGTDVASVDFTSLQDPSEGPNGDSCDDWTLNYTMVAQGGSWLIDQAVGQQGSTHTSCG